MERKQPVTAALVVAHPDDETLWAGGTVLMHPDWQWTVVSLCRATDRDRAPRFQQAVQKLGGRGRMGDLDDGPEQSPLSGTEVQQVLRSLLPSEHFNLVLTHSPYGEYTRHRRHEETSQAVASLWLQGLIVPGEVWMFAYEDSGKGGRDDLPQIIKTAHLVVQLPEDIQREKYRTITEIYGFTPQSYEARIALKEEAFWCFRSAGEFQQWLVNNKRRER
ncbi:MAG: PIG-L family deacetylase [Chloroflexi bacterium]|nr:PIG-L family deacetylase [Chloroflexota bacterium]